MNGSPQVNKVPGFRLTSFNTCAWRIPYTVGQANETTTASQDMEVLLEGGEIDDQRHNMLPGMLIDLDNDDKETTHVKWNGNTQDDPEHGNTTKVTNKDIGNMDGLEEDDQE